ncbi:MAG: winged helix-turn-helix domain-containing protein [Chitinophagaceae bacterium]
MKQKRKGRKEMLYLQIAKTIEKQIQDEVLKMGDKLPSIRMVCREQGVSMSTAQLAYSELQSKSLIESRPQSGYYVSHSHKKHLELPQTSKPKTGFSEKSSENLVAKVYDTISEKILHSFRWAFLTKSSCLLQN